MLAATSSARSKAKGLPSLTSAALKALDSASHPTFHTQRMSPSLASGSRLASSATVSSATLAPKAPTRVSSASSETKSTAKASNIREYGRRSKTPQHVPVLLASGRMKKGSKPAPKKVSSLPTPTHSQAAPASIANALNIPKIEAIPTTKTLNINKTVVLPSGITTRQARRCGHVVHPAHDGYQNSLCPPCALLTETQLTIQNQKVISEHGGWIAWQQLANDNTGKSEEIARDLRPEYKQATTGRDRYLGKDLAASGWRNRKVKLLRWLDHIEKLSQKEARWEKEHADLNLEKSQWLDNTAQVALDKYAETKRTEALDTVEQDSLNTSYDLGRICAEEVAAAWNDKPQDAESAQEPVESSIGSLEETITGKKRSRSDDLDEQLPKDKRRRVLFDPEVTLRAEADIDVLRKSASFAVMPHTFRKIASPRRGILRSANSTPSPKRPELQKSLLAKLKLPYSILQLSDKPSRKLQSFNSKLRHGGKWSQRNHGYVTVNTSLSSPEDENSDAAWKARKEYNQELQEEAKDWDIRDEVDEMYESTLQTVYDATNSVMRSANAIWARQARFLRRRRHHHE